MSAADVDMMPYAGCPACDACGLPITEDPHTPADLVFHPECCPDPDCPQNEGGQ